MVTVPPGNGFYNKVLRHQHTTLLMIIWEISKTVKTWFQIINGLGTGKPKYLIINSRSSCFFFFKCFVLFSNIPIFFNKFIYLLIFIFGCTLQLCGILVPWPGIKPTLPALEGRVLTTRPPGKSRSSCFKYFF